jgi:DNA uptake protein ComE-like DNA-binding protein
MVLRKHQNSMPLTPRSFLRVFTIALFIAGLTACTQQQSNPDEIRQRTAEATETLKRDTKAVVEGVRQGLNSDKTVDINKASREDLLTLPGITEREADHIIAERPFDKADDLVRRHVISQAEYEKIRGRVIAGR